MGIGTLRRHRESLGSQGLAAEAARDLAEAEAAGSAVAAADADVQLDADLSALAEAEAAVPAAAEADEAEEAPPANGRGSSIEAWVRYALTHGRTEQDLDGLTRDEIVALFDPAEPLS